MAARSASDVLGDANTDVFLVHEVGLGLRHALETSPSGRQNFLKYWQYQGRACESRVVRPGPFPIPATGDLSWNFGSVPATSHEDWVYGASIPDEVLQSVRPEDRSLELRQAIEGTWYLYSGWAAAGFFFRCEHGAWALAGLDFVDVDRCFPESD